MLQFTLESGKWTMHIPTLWRERKKKLKSSFRQNTMTIPGEQTGLSNEIMFFLLVLLLFLFFIFWLKDISHFVYSFLFSKYTVHPFVYFSNGKMKKYTEPETETETETKCEKSVKKHFGKQNTLSYGERIEFSFDRQTQPRTEREKNTTRKKNLQNSKTKQKCKEKQPKCVPFILWYIGECNWWWSIGPIVKCAKSEKKILLHINGCVNAPILK